MTITEAERSPITHARRPSRRPIMTAAIVGISVLLSGLLVGCIAPAGESEEGDDAGVELKAQDQLDEQSTGLATSNANAANAQNATVGIPATPEPGNTPQPFPWKPTNPTTTQTSPAASPVTTPQPFPWQGHTPPPAGPSTGPSQVEAVAP